MLKKQFFCASLLIALSATVHAKVIEVTSSNFDKEVKQSKKPVVVDMYAPWCGPCQKMAPIFDEVEAEMNHLFKFVKIDGDKESKISESVGLTSFPSFYIYHKGKLHKKSPGSKSKDKLKKFLNDVLKEVESL